MKKSLVDRELDADVAEKIFGWKINRALVALPLLPYHGYEKDAQEWWKIPFFSSDREDAWKVVIKINERQGYLYDRFYQLYDGFDLKLVKQGQPIEQVRVDPREICIAALQACKDQDELSQPRD